MHDFIDHMRHERHKAENTLIAYERDLAAFEKFLKERGRDSLDRCTDSDAVAYVMRLGSENKSKQTINRKISALKNYYEFLISKGRMSENPFTKIKSVRTDRRQIDYLTVEEAAALMELPGDDVKGLRDRALLEFMYGTGARVTEIVRFRFSDMNLMMGFVTLRDVNDESRIVPLGSYASKAMKKYVDEAYGEICGKTPDEDDFVFVNFRGDPLTRQGIWKILKDYGQALGLESRMTPQILRDSFAVHILRNGGDLRTLQELMGFEDMTVGVAYLYALEVRVREVFMNCHPRA